jgi:hypothetical protein
VKAHQGHPREVLGELLPLREFADYFGLSGHRGHISELAAIQRGLRELRGALTPWLPWAASPFWSIHLPMGKITTVLSRNKRAAASGEFFVQQIGRIGGLAEHQLSARKAALFLVVPQLIAPAMASALRRLRKPASA